MDILITRYDLVLQRVFSLFNDEFSVDKHVADGSSVEREDQHRKQIRLEISCNGEIVKIYGEAVCEPAGKELAAWDR